MTKTVKFLGGPLDEIVHYLKEKENWDLVTHVALVNQPGRITHLYKYDGTSSNAEHSFFAIASRPCTLTIDYPSKEVRVVKVGITDL